MQAERTSDRAAGGLGLGLALVKSLVDLHGGNVTCNSEGLGHGSKFTVCLPRIVAQGRRDDPSHAGNALQPGRRSLRILVVDDNADAAAMLTMLLEAAGHQVLVEHESCQALKRAKLEKPNICLLDIGLPEMDGNELAQHLRAQPETAKAVLIAVTGYGQEIDRKRTLAAGFDHHLVKPLDTRKLATILAGIVEN
jgi:CheY-like chemotaxis protein